MVGAARIRQWKREQVPPAPDRLPADVRRAVASMRAWDVQEHVRLAAWWAEHGHIIANANRTRPDGTVRGETYLFGQY